MIQLGQIQKLKIVRKKDFGVYLADPENMNETILLPGKYVPEQAGIGTQVEVFVYRDSSDRLIATTLMPKLTLGQMGLLTVKQVTKIGVFMDWGLEKDLLVPFKEQTYRPVEGQECLVALYIDKSNRLAGTMKIYDYLETEHTYKKDDMVKGLIYQVSEDFGAFIAVDGKYHGMVPKKNYHGGYRPGTEVTARVVKVREDGKMELSLSQKVHIQMDLDADMIYQLIDSYGGVLPFTEKATPEVIERETGLSKAAFKRAVGRLLKLEKIQIVNGKIRKY